MAGFFCSAAGKPTYLFGKEWFDVSRKVNCLEMLAKLGNTRIQIHTNRQYGDR